MVTTLHQTIVTNIRWLSEDTASYQQWSVIGWWENTDTDDGFNVGRGWSLLGKWMVINDCWNENLNVILKKAHKYAWRMSSSEKRPDTFPLSERVQLLCFRGSSANRIHNGDEANNISSGCLHQLFILIHHTLLLLLSTVRPSLPRILLRIRWSSSSTSSLHHIEQNPHKNINFRIICQLRRQCLDKCWS